MQEAVLSPLATWQNFYTIIGSAAATLTGLLFVVITLTAGVRVRVSSPSSGIAVFNTQNVVHFGAALLVAAILSAPWQALWTAGLLLGLAGLGGRPTLSSRSGGHAAFRWTINRCWKTGCGIWSCRWSPTPPSSSRR